MKKHIGKNCILDKRAKIGENVEIGNNCEIEGDCFLQNAKIGDNVKIKSSYILDSEICSNTTVGPFSHIKQGSKIGERCRVGNFVEIKNSTLGDGTKCAHLTYIGDAEVGKRVNVGCGVVFANYDGKKKHKTVVGNDVFIGCNCNLVAPLTIENNCFIAAGTTVTKDLPLNSFCIGRSRQEVKERIQE